MMTVNKNADRDLADYLRRRLEYIHFCNAEIQSKLFDDGRELCSKIDDGEYSKNDPAVGQIIFHIEYVVANTFRYTMLVGICSFLEEAMKAITKRLLSDCEGKLRSQKEGNWLHKQIRVLCDSAELNVVPIKRHVDTFHNLITLRNCIVHAWGNVAEARDSAAVKAAAQQVEDAAISADGYLVLGDQVVPQAIIAAEEIAEHVLSSKLRVSMI